MTNKVELYDELAANYDLMVDWKSRLDGEAAFLRRIVDAAGARTVLDLACGTAMHSVLLARWGLEVVAADPSEKMLEKARENIREAGVDVRLVQAGFGEVGSLINRDFDAVLCLGNSLPHLLTRGALASALGDVFTALAPGGVFVTQNRNYDKVVAERNRFMPLDAVERDGKEILFFRLLDFGEELITFNIVTLIREEGKWSYSVSSTKHRPVLKAEIEELLRGFAFTSISFHGDLKGSVYHRDASGDLVVVARKPS